MSGNKIIDANLKALNCIEFIVNFPALGDVNKGGVFDYKAVKGEERARYSTLFAQLERDAGPIESMQISRHGPNAEYSKITVTTDGDMDDIQLHNIKVTIEDRICPHRLKESPLVAESALKEFEANSFGDYYEPTASPDSEPELYAMQYAVSEVLRDIMPGIRRDGGNYTVMDVRPGAVDLIAEGACIACPSSIEATTRRMFEEMVYDMSQLPNIIKTPLESLNVYSPEDFMDPAYSIRQDGVYDARGQRTRIFQTSSPAPAAM